MTNERLQRMFGHSEPAAPELTLTVNGRAYRIIHDSMADDLVCDLDNRVIRCEMLIWLSDLPDLASHIAEAETDRL